MNKLILSLMATLLSGCAFTRPHLIEISTTTNGVVTRKEMWLPAFVVWPGTQTLEKQRGSIGKTLSAGFTVADQDSTGTNAVEALKAIDSIMSKVR